MYRFILSLFLVLTIMFAFTFSTSHAHDVGDKNTMDKKQTIKVVPEPTNPRAIFLGKINEAPGYVKNELPAGYSSRVVEELEFDINTGDPEDRRAMFVIDESGVTNVEEVMKWAAASGKEEVYFFFQEFTPPGTYIAYTPFELNENIKNILNDLYGIIDLDWEKHILDIIGPTEVYANSVPSKGTKASSSDVLIPSGNCHYIGFNPDDIPGDGQQPHMRLCLMYNAWYFGHVFPMISHTRRNAAAHYPSGQNSKSVADCMKFYNGSSTHKYPVNLKAYVYSTSSQLIPFCGQAVNGCAPGAPLPTSRCGDPTFPNCNQSAPTGTRKIYNKNIYINEGGYRNIWTTVRHEMLHHYGYGHCHMQKDTKSSGRCIMRTVGGGTCGGSVVFKNPEHRYF